jgi:hypothetical protein
LFGFEGGLGEGVLGLARAPNGAFVVFISIPGRPLMDEDYFDPIADALSGEHLSAIGYLTAASSILETVMDEVIVFLIGTNDRVGDILTSRLNFQARIDLIRTLADERLSDQIAKDLLDHLLERIEGAQKERNEIVHARWRETKDPALAVAKKITAKRKLQTTISKWTAVEIHRRAEQIDFVMRDLSIWITNLQINRSLGIE